MKGLFDFCLSGLRRSKQGFVVNTFSGLILGMKYSTRIGSQIVMLVPSLRNILILNFLVGSYTK